MIELRWHKYKYFPYERNLAVREVEALLGQPINNRGADPLLLDGSFPRSTVERLVYFASARDDTCGYATLQGKLENPNGKGQNRQATRYSVHGLHEYKGKFNPQIARSLLNVLEIPLTGRVLDPFCGSGTTLVECAHDGINAVGADMNPLAAFIANAKLTALRIPSSRIREDAASIIDMYRCTRTPELDASSSRVEYLLKWFDPEILGRLELLRFAIHQVNPETSAVLLTIASNLLRDYSLQDPNDLRIRRRKTPLPERPFIEAFEADVHEFTDRLGYAQNSLGGIEVPANRALLADSRELHLGSNGMPHEPFDGVLTSPPYATALPYIDTQRLSLVWLGLTEPSEVLPLDANLIGSREVRGKRTRESLSHSLRDNADTLPQRQHEFCMTLVKSLSDRDGFRRQAVPLLLYRYFSGMAAMFRSVRQCTKRDAAYALVVGHNHTVLGGTRFDIDTPQHLVEIAEANGWRLSETIPLDTYQRYGYHMRNAVVAETLVILRAA